MTTSPYTARAGRHELPAASLDAYRASENESPRAWTVRDLQAWNVRETMTASRDDDPRDATLRAIRGIVR